MHTIKGKQENGRDREFEEAQESLNKDDENNSAEKQASELVVGRYSCGAPEKAWLICSSAGSRKPSVEKFEKQEIIPDNVYTNYDTSSEAPRDTILKKVNSEPKNLELLYGLGGSRPKSPRKSPSFTDSLMMSYFDGSLPKDSKNERMDKREEMQVETSAEGWHCESCQTQNPGVRMFCQRCVSVRLTSKAADLVWVQAEITGLESIDVSRVAYVITVQLHRNKWVIFRQFKDFERFIENLREEGHQLNTSLPDQPRGFFEKMNPRLGMEQQNHLQAILNDATNSVNIYDSKTLQDFLEVKDLPCKDVRTRSFLARDTSPKMKHHSSNQRSSKRNSAPKRFLPNQKKGDRMKAHASSNKKPASEFCPLENVALDRFMDGPHTYGMGCKGQTQRTPKHRRRATMAFSHQVSYYWKNCARALCNASMNCQAKGHAADDSDREYSDSRSDKDMISSNCSCESDQMHPTNYFCTAFGCLNVSEALTDDEFEIDERPMDPSLSDFEIRHEYFQD